MAQIKDKYTLKDVKRIKYTIKHKTFNQGVEGSNPSGPTTQNP